MAYADYRLCDICRGKAFYDASLNYETGHKDGDKFVYPENQVREAGVSEPYGYALGRLGDWAVLCIDCAKTHKTQIVPMDDPAPPKQG